MDEMALVDAPEGPGGRWTGVWRDRFGEHWVGLPDQTCLPVHRYGTDWVTKDGYSPVTIFARDGRMVRPKDDQLFMEEVDTELEREIVKLIQGNLAAGVRVHIEDLARFRIAKRRLG